MRRLLAAAVLATALGGCSHAGPGPAAPAYAGVGYVRVEDAVRRHPLYPQVIQYDEEIAVLQGAGVPTPPVDPAEMRKRESELQRNLATAAANAKAELARLRAHYEQQERVAIDAAMKAAGVAPPGNGGAGVVSGVAGTFQEQARAVDERAQKAFDAYREEVIAQDRAQLDAAAKRFSDEADRKYRGKVRDLESAEAQLAQQLAEKSAPQRLALRTKLQNLALDDAARKQLEQQLQALDQADADQVAELRNRDQKTLQAYQAELRSQVQTQMQAYADKVHRDTRAKLEQRAGAERQAVQQQIKALAPQVGRQLAGFDISKLPPDLRARIQAIHEQFAQRYQKDAQGELDRFNKTRDALSQRYAALHGAAGAADAATAKQVAQLRTERDQLYARIVGEIESTARDIGKERGLKVVLGGAVAGGTGVDLTSAVERAVEKAHA
ncbi:MAG TPA: hypothetical protein VNJ51_08120 [Candidatus Dormibacteraeota bacterium]|nr:hypothetical protein [Candidatus Dormibacteraeota bacterium]